MRPPVSVEIPNAERTVLAAGYVNTDGEPAYFSREQFAALKIEWPVFFEKARANASLLLDSLKPEFERDKKNVIEFATLHSENPLTAGTIFAPDFLKKFANTLGEPLLVATPNRHTVFIFPKLASRPQEYGQMVRDAYHESSHPVSLEVFELSKNGLRAAGVYREP